MADAFKAAFNGSTENRLNCACIWFPSLPFFFSPPPLFQRLIDPLSLNASISFPFHSLSTFSFFTLLYFTRLAFAKFKKISTFLSYQISISSRLFFPRRRIFSLFFIPDLCTDFPRSKSRVETQRGRDRSRKRNIIPGELFQIENGTRLSREKATATLARRIKLRCSFRENFTLLHFAGASGGGRESPIRWRPPREGDNFPWSHVTRRGRKEGKIEEFHALTFNSLAAGLFRSARSLNFSQQFEMILSGTNETFIFWYFILENLSDVQVYIVVLSDISIITRLWIFFISLIFHLLILYISIFLLSILNE